METVENGSSEATSELEVKRGLFVQYCAAMNCDPETGEKVTMAVFAKKIKVDVKTLYAWQRLPDHKDLVADATDDQLLRDLPIASKIIRKHAMKGSFNHLKLWYLQANRLKAEKHDITSDGKALPTPILGGISLGDSVHADNGA